MAARKLRTKEQFIEEAVLKHGNKYSYQNVEWQGNWVKTNITCLDHGDFLQAPGSHLQGHGCPRCYHERASREFLDRAKEIHGDKYDYSKVVYKGCFDKVVIGCKDHGDFLQQPNAHIGKLRQGCVKCHREREKIRLEAISVQMGNDFADKATKVHEGRYDYSLVKYTRSRFKVEIICKEHGSFWQIANNHLKGSGCNECHPGGFNNKLSGFVYILIDGDTTKVGITNKTPQQRAGVVNWLGEKNFHVVSAFKFANGTDAQAVEKKLLQYLRQRYSNTELKHHGSTECFVDVTLSDVVAQLCLFSVQYESEVYSVEREENEIQEV